MSVTVGKLFGNGAVLYQMKLLAGQKGLNNLVEWVHIIENDEVSQFLHGNEVVFTSGILNNNDNWLLEYAKKLYSVGTSAFVVNIGPYTKGIPQKVIEYCDSVNIPLYTIPWETRMVDVTRDICYRIMKSEETEASIASTIKNIIFKVGDLDTLISQMERYGYLRDSRFCFIAIAFENSQNKDKEYNMKKIKMYSEKIARSIHQLYISFAYNDCCILVLVDYSDYDIDNFVNTFLKNWDDDLWKIHIGISENLNDIRVQDENFNKALTAMKMAKKKGKKVRDYKKLDIYKLLLNSKDKQVLKEYYEDTIGKLEKYDEENNTDLTDFLYMYLKNNGSQSLVAEKQYIHRNTVNNQLKKIEKITGYNPLDLEEKLRFYLGFYIKDLL
ncbi:PucR family transcriptional regulator ligand-binding domain-containing protein [Clostridium sp. YIM B02555]|uniref:PucR family transcriptional regulator n=1 Tax=Clostridium sp. YIM B02555 TaxID=2911968 RepID=UPI001EEEC426|nr:PucR family transcriptional regulator ligand-binding domain-containing protein [Clostridium sp. YIM B02555]